MLTNVMALQYYYLELLKVEPLNVEIVETHQQRQIWIAQKWQWSRVLNKTGKKGAKLQN